MKVAWTSKDPVIAVRAEGQQESARLQVESSELDIASGYQNSGQKHGESS